MNTTAQDYLEFLANMEGRWRGRETFAAGIISEREVEAETRSDCTLQLDGQLATLHFHQHFDEAPSHRGIAVYRVAHEPPALLMHWYDELDPEPVRFTGTISNGNLVLVGSMHQRAMRTTVEVHGDSMHSRTEMQQSDQSWQTVLQGQFVRQPPVAVGSIVWRDLTVNNAVQVRDFYQTVVGWQVEACDMGDYSDFSMLAADDECVAGVCHHRGVNEGIPPQWLQYVQVENLDDCISKAKSLGGEIVYGPKTLAGQHFCVVRDPAGAVLALCGPRA